MIHRKQNFQRTLPFLAQPQDVALPTKLQLSSAVYEQIRDTIGSKKAEQGGILGVKEERSIVEHLYFDASADATNGTYSPDHTTPNNLLKTQGWPEEIEFVGFVHSHPQYIKHPSGGDLAYARTILQTMASLPYLLL